MRAVFAEEFPDLGPTEENLREFLNGCNEIETMVFYGLLELPLDCCTFNGAFTFVFNGISYEVDAQAIDKNMERRYKADFMVTVPDFNNSKNNKSYVIEIDGHAYHNLTKEQAQHDRERDRMFAKHGYTVLRFTGSECFLNPSKCWIELFNIHNSNNK